MKIYTEDQKKHTHTLLIRNERRVIRNAQTVIFSVAILLVTIFTLIAANAEAIHNFLY